MLAVLEVRAVLEVLVLEVLVLAVLRCWRCRHLSTRSTGTAKVI